MANLKLDPVTHDLIPGRAYARTKDAELVVQNVKSRLQTFYREWLLGPNLGIPWLEVLDKSYNLEALRTIIYNTILSTNGVESVSDLVLITNTTTRKLEITFYGTTVYGKFSDTVSI